MSQELCLIYPRRKRNTEQFFGGREGGVSFHLHKACPYQISSGPLTISIVGVLGAVFLILLLSWGVTSDGVIGTHGVKG